MVKILFMDTETTPLSARLWRLGKNHISHNHLISGYFSRYHIMTIQYKWAHEKQVHILTWGKSLADEKKMIEEFDRIQLEADIIIGKNNMRFDMPMLATQRFWFDLPANLSTLTRTDDLESQLRKHFYLPSFALDYVSKELGLGGKDKMEMGDWVDMCNARVLQLSGLTQGFSTGVRKLAALMFDEEPDKIIIKGEKATTKMIKYGAKDILDTERVWNYASKHFAPKFNYSHYLQKNCCRNCGSEKIVEEKKRTYSNSREQVYYFCQDGQHYAGRSWILKNGQRGKIS